jgi:Mg-chelatase subunit ChlD
MYKTKHHRTYNSLLISVVAHCLFVIIMGFFIKTTYEPAAPPIAVEWVKAPPVEIKAPKQLPLSLSKSSPAAGTKSPSPLPVRSARKSAHEIPQVKVEDVEIVRESVEINRDAKISDVLPIISTSAQFQTDVKTRDTIDLPTSTPLMVEAPGSGQRTGRVRAAGFGDTQGLADVDSFGTEQYGVIGTGEGGSGGGVGDGGIGDGFADVGTKAPKIIDIDSQKPGKDIFGIGEYVDKTREGKEQQVVYVLDVSSSMNKKSKLYLAIQALKDSLAMLQKNDQFNIITFDSDVNIYSNEMLPVTRKNLQRAYSYMDTLQTNAGTYLSGTLKEALSLKTSTIVVISDGKPSRGIMDTEEFLAFVKKSNRQHAHIMTIALGEQRKFQGVELLQKLSAQNNGEMKLINIQ